jgi:hypothetical protein
MPCQLDFTQLPLAIKDRAAVLEAARILADNLPVERVVLYGSKGWHRQLRISSTASFPRCPCGSG